jgi:hypothetical protein
MNNVGGVIPANPPVIPAKAGIHLRHPGVLFAQLPRASALGK